MPWRNVAGALALDTTLQAIRDRLLAVLSVRTADVFTATLERAAVGSEDLVTPSDPANQLIVTWSYVQARASVGNGVVGVTVSLERPDGGTNSYEVELTGSQPFMHTATWIGAPGAPLVIEADTAGAIVCNADYREQAP